VKAQDLFAPIGVQDLAARPPLKLVYVAEAARMADARDDEQLAAVVGADAGCVAQNVYLHNRTSAGLASVVRGLVDRRRLAPALGLAREQRTAPAQTVGYPAEHA